MKPRFAATDIQRLARTEFGLKASVSELPSYTDQNHLLSCDDGSRYVMKVSNSDEDLGNLELQVRVLQHLCNSEISGLFPRVIPSRNGRGMIRVPGAGGQSHWVRVVTYLDGFPVAKLSHHPPRLLYEIGRTMARLDEILETLSDPPSQPPTPWDLTRAPEVCEQLDMIEDDRRRGLIQGFVRRFESVVEPSLGCLGRSIIHNDCNEYNLLVDNLDPASASLCGLIDFGDMLHCITIAELAVGCAYLMLGKDDPWAAIGDVISGYHSVKTVTPLEQSLLFDLAVARLCTSVVMSAQLQGRFPDNEYLVVSAKPAWKVLEKLAMITPEHAHRQAQDACAQGCAPARSAQEILTVRHHHVGANLSVAYHQPLKIVRGQGQYLYDDQGVRYLDLVNNVCHVGHCHPHVVKAAQRQLALLNTNTRYLYDGLAEYAVRLTERLPDPLQVCFFVCTGTEANDLALRLAEAHTGSREIIVVDHAYHGHSRSLIEISPYKCEGKGGQGLAPHAHKVAMPCTFRGAFKGPDAGPQYAELVAQAARQVDSEGKQLGAFMAESLIGCGGQVVLPEGYLDASYQAVRAAGGVCIADEVQVGFGRVGSHFWGFDTQAVVPDIVTLGKPIGNGHPLAAVVTTPEVAASFDTGMEYFNTFGGNPVSCAVGLAVLEVIDQENLQEHARLLGEHFMNGLRELQKRHALIGDVRGRGLFIGVELVRDMDELTPAKSEASQIIEKMKQRGVLLSTDGPFENVLKIKPPMVLQSADVDEALEKLDGVLAEVAHGARRR